MLQRLGIRGKLLAVVALPLVALLVALGAVVAGQVADYRVAHNAELLVNALDSARQTERDLQAERWTSLNFVDAIVMGRLARTTAEESVDERLGAVEDALAAVRDRSVVEESDNSDEIYTQASYDADVAEAEQLWADVRGAASGDRLDRLRAVTVTPAAAAGEWVGFPAEADIAAMADEYASISARLDELSAGASDSLDMRAAVAALSLAIETEAAEAERMVREPQEHMAVLAELFPEVDAGLDAVREAAAQVPATAENALALRAVSEGASLREQLPELRAGVMAAAADGSTLLTYYTTILNQFVLANGQIAVSMPDRANVAGMQTYADIDQLVEYLEYEKAYTERLIRRGSFQSTESTTVRGVQERTRVALAAAKASASGLGSDLAVPDLGASIDLSTNAGTSFESIRNRLYDGIDSALAVVKNDDWAGKADQEIAQYTPIADALWETIDEDVAANSQAAVRNTVIALAGAVAAVIVILVITFAIARRITVPLRRLTTTATAVREELPRLVERVAMPGEDVDVSEVQIAVDSQDEVGRLAEAFNGVNAATIEIAREQAALRSSISEMFVNVARRDQVLLNRQLSSIDEMERTEDDPNRLTKLFALDHLATRMRRNSESLLVLAGIDTGRRLRRAMPLSDVVRTASSEIELYERIDLDLVVDPSMLGHQALTAAHLFAELLENATVFSDPGSRVVVRTGRTEGGFTVEVIDTGIGMTAEELAEANSRVQSSAASEILGAQRLGLFVVGRIARRLGAHVAITAEEGTGTVVTVLLPQQLFETVGDAPEESAAPAVEAYAPAAVVPGAPLVAPAAEDDAPALPARAETPAAPVAPAAVPVPAAPVADHTVDDDAPIPVPTLEDLIAADQATAPAGEAVSGTELTDGTSSAGLPTRRRRREDQGVGEDRNVIGLPVRATADQLSALDAEAAAFTPSVSAAEVTPQSPEQRSSMFRGFRSRRDVAPPGAETTMDLPSLGESGASALPSRRREVEPEVVPDAAPALEAAAPEVASAEAAAPEAAPSEPAPERQIPTAAALGGAFAAFDAIRRASAPQAGAEAHAAEAPAPDAPASDVPVADAAPAAAALPSFSMPKLAPTPTEPVAAAPEIDAPAPEAPETPAASLAHVWDAPTDAATDVPALETEAAEEPAAAPVAEPEPFVVPLLEPDALPVPPSEEQLAPWLMAAETAAQAPQAPAEEPEAPAFLESPFARSPYGAAFAARPEDAAPAPVQAEEMAPAPEPVAYEAAYEAPAAAPVPDQPAEAAPEPAPWMSGAEFAVRAAQFEPASEPAPVTQPSMDDIIAQASGEEAGRAGFFGRLFGRGRAEAEAPAAPAASPSFAPSAFAPTSFDPHAAPAPAEQAVFEPAPQAQAEPAPAAFTPAPSSFEPEPGGYQPLAPAFEPAPASSLPREAASAEPAYSPEELASPLGWEAAGESALAATFGAAPTAYEPMIDTEHSSGRSFAYEEAEITSAVFSELSSLSEQRPVVEKTKAGLQRRQRAPQAEVAPIAAEVTLTPKDRDAEAVRNRFSSFYSGTQRARTDVAELELRSTPEPAHE